MGSARPRARGKIFYTLRDDGLIIVDILRLLKTEYAILTVFVKTSNASFVAAP